jgi:colicin import membrane protein
MVTKQHTPDGRNPAAEKNGSRGFIIFFTLSFIGHVVIFALFLLLPDAAPAKKYMPTPHINVSLVSDPSQEAPPRPSSKATRRVSKQSVSSKVSAGSDKKVSVAPVKSKAKKSLKKKTFKSSKVLKQAISKLEKKVEDSRPPALNEAIDKLKRRVAETDPAERRRKEAVENLARKGSGTGDGSLTDRYRISGVMQIYNAEIKYQIQKNWVFSEQFAGSNTELETALVIKILPNGEITDIWFDKKSGNAHLDDSAYKALVKSNPLPPLPEEYTRPEYPIGFRFGPKGLK